MTLIEHLYELRRRLFKAAIFVVLGTVVGWLFYNHILDVLKEPYCSLPASHRIQAGNGSDKCTLLFFGPLDGFLIRLKVSAISGLILSSPFWLYQLWAFITPGLKKSERRLTVIFVLCSTVLFIGGAALAYLTLSKGLHLLIGSAGDGTAAALAVTNYLSFVMAMLLIFGISFEFPLLVVMLNRVGVLSYERLRKWLRAIVFMVFVFAAIATPSQDPFTMCALAVPMCVLFGVALLIARSHDKRKHALEAAAAFHDVSDDEASPLDTTPTPIDEPEPVDDESQH